MKFEVYRRWTIYGRKWFWRLKGSNHRIIAVGGESFQNKDDVLDIIQTMMDDLQTAMVRITE